MIYRILILSLFTLIFFTDIDAADFTTPSRRERMKAISTRKGLQPDIRKAFEPGDDFSPVPEPGPHDWLTIHKEPGQSYKEYIRSEPVRPESGKNIIYFQPVGVFPDGKSPPLDSLEEYARAFFTLEISVLPALSLKDHNLTTRINQYTGNRQILTTDVLYMLQKKMPKDAYCVLAITMEDLYPETSWNFVFGQASLRDRVGVFSFARYDPAFYGEPRTQDYEIQLLFRSCKVLAHETCHMFGLYHCIFYHCMMNGSNHLEESNARPLHLCPVCLHKLYYTIEFDIRDRYVDLLRFHEKEGFHKEAGWIVKRLKNISK
jgi:archaemetzincin